MGKQIQILVNKRKREMLEYLIDKGYLLVALNHYLEKSKVVFISSKNEIDEMLLSLHIIYVFSISKQEALKMVKIAHYGERIGDSGKLVELCFSNILVDEKRIIRGRIYFGNGFSTPLTEEEAEIGNSVYKEVVKWVKRNIPYRLVRDNTLGKIVEYKIYVEDYIYELSNSANYTLH